MGYRLLPAGSLFWLPLAVLLSTACGGGDSGTGPSGPPPVATVTVTPARDTVLLRDVVAVGVAARDSSGALLAGRTVTWSYSDSSMVTLLAGGSLRGEKLGTLRVVATVEGKSDTVNIVFVPLVVFSRRFPSLFTGDTTLLRVSTTDIFGDPVAASAPVWSSANPAILTISTQGIVSGLQTGAAYLRAQAAGGLDSQLVTVLSPSGGTNRQISFLHDSSTAAYLRAQELWRADADGSNPLRLTPDGFSVLFYRWSPDGSRLVVQGGPQVGPILSIALYTVSADGSAPVPLGVGGLIPDWSPDGQRLAYYQTSTSDIAVINADGSGEHRLNLGSGVNTDPRWSPDGHRIAWRKQIGISNQIWIADDDGTHQQQLPIPASLTPIPVEWSPDGKALAMGASGVWLINADGSGFRPLSPQCSLPATCTGVSFWTTISWAPDGQLVTYDTHDQVSSSVVVIGRDGTGELTFPITTVGFTLTPLFSPDGQRIVFGSTNPADTVSQVGVSYSTMSTSGQNLVLGRLTMQGYNPRWRP